MTSIITDKELCGHLSLSDEEVQELARISRLPLSVGANLGLYISRRDLASWRAAADAFIDKEENNNEQSTPRGAVAQSAVATSSQAPSSRRWRRTSKSTGKAPSVYAG